MSRHIKRFAVLVAGVLWLNTGASAQHYLGVRGGYGGGLGRFEGRANYEMRLWLGGPSGGISWKYYSPVPIVGAVQADLQYVTKGYKRVFFTTDNNTGLDTDHWAYSRRLTALELPLFWHNHFYVNKRRTRIFLNLGVYASYYLDAHERQERLPDGSQAPPGGEFDRPYVFHAERDNRFDYGLAGGAGFSYLIDRFEVFLEGRYSFAYADLMKAPGKYPGNELSRTPVDMLNVSVGVYYRLGKGGILAPPPSAGRNRSKWKPVPSRSLDSE